MISPAFTTWPPKRLTPRRWAFESRPLRLDDAPFLCAISVLLRLGGLGACGLGPGALGPASHSIGSLGFGVDAGDPDLGVPLPVAQTPPVAGLVPVLDHVDLGACRVTDDVRRDLIAADLGGVADDAVAVYYQQGRERNARADLTGQLVDGDDLVQHDLFLPAAAAHNRVHPRTLSFLALISRASSLALSCVPRHTGVTTAGSLERAHGARAAGNSRPPRLPDLSACTNPARSAPCLVVTSTVLDVAAPSFLPGFSG